MTHWQPELMLEAVQVAAKAAGLNPEEWQASTDGDEWWIENTGTTTSIAPTWGEPSTVGRETFALPTYRVFYWKQTGGYHDDPPDLIDKTLWEGQSPWEAAKRAALASLEEAVATALEALAYRWQPEDEL